MRTIAMAVLVVLAGCAESSDPAAECRALTLEECPHDAVCVVGCAITTPGTDPFCSCLIRPGDK